MPPALDMISALSPQKDSWRFKARVIRLWNISMFSNPKVSNSMEMILMDKDGNKIQATVRKPILNKFKDVITEGGIYRVCNGTLVPNSGFYRTTQHEYKLIFVFRTTVTPVVSSSIPTHGLSLKSFDELLQMKEDTDYLVDVIGLLTTVTEDKEYEREGRLGKMIVIELASDSHKIRCALFGEYMDQVHEFLGAGYPEQLVVVLQYVKVKLFRGKVGLQNVMYATKIMFNPDMIEVSDFKQGLIEEGVLASQPLVVGGEKVKHTLEDEFMKLTLRTSTEALHANNEDGSFVVFGEISAIVEYGTWWYSSCVCGHTVKCGKDANGNDLRVYYCEFCHSHITNVVPRFRVKIEVTDDSGPAIFIIFDREASYIFKKTCAQLFAEHEKDVEIICGPSFPPLFNESIGKKLLFKVETKKVGVDVYTGTFWVRRVCDDPHIITMFALSGSNDTPSKGEFAPTSSTLIRLTLKIPLPPMQAVMVLLPLVHLLVLIK